MGDLIMKVYIKILFFIVFLLLLPLNCVAQSQYSDTLFRMEKALFNMDYSSQSDDSRLKRIEESVYGSSSTSPVSQRIKRLSKDLSSDLIGHEIKPKKDSFLEDDEIIAKQEDETMDYALVNNLEKKVFQYEFKTLDLGHRLSSLEGQVFKKSYVTDDLSTRISRLNAAVMYNKFPASDDKIVQTPIPQQKLLTLENLKEQKLIPIPNSIEKQEQILDPRIQLVSLEKSVFATSFPDEKSSERLTRLESKVLSSTFPDDDELTRLNRIEGAYGAKGSIKKYKSNRASQRTATAIQMGTIILMLLPLLL